MTPDIPYRDREVFELDAPIGNFSKPGYPRRRPAPVDEHARANQDAREVYLARFESEIEPNLDKMTEAQLRAVFKEIFQVSRGRRRVARRRSRVDASMKTKGSNLGKAELIRMIGMKAHTLKRSVRPKPPAEIVDTGQAGRDLYAAIAQYRDQDNPIGHCGVEWAVPTERFPGAFVQAGTDFFNNYRDCEHFDETSGRSRGSVVVSIQFMDKPDFRRSNLWLKADHESPARGGRSMVVPLLSNGGRAWEFRGFENLSTEHKALVRREVTVENLLAKFQALLAGEEGVEHYISHDCD